MPKLSVVVPIYKVEPFIERCVRSLMEQTLEDIEYIFVDDATPDRSIEILESVIREYPDRAPSVKLLRNPQNLGLPRTRRRGFEVATADYIISCDSDDWTDKTMYEKMYRKAIEGDFDMVWCDHYRSDGTSREPVAQRSAEDRFSMVGNILSGRMMGTVWNRMFRRSFLMREDFIYPTLGMIEDVVFTVQATLMSARIAHVAEPLYYYYCNGDSISRTREPERILRNHEALVENTAIVEQVLRREGLAERFAEELDYSKCINKEVLLPLLGERKYRRMWLETNAEINGRILGNPLIPRFAKIRSVCFRYRLAPLYLLWKRLRGR